MRRAAATVAAAVAAAALAGCAGEEPAHLVAGCDRADLGGRSVARVWDEALLDAIRRDVPAPTVHARNLFHVSAAMWDAWAAYDGRASGYFVREKHEAEDVRAARETALSYAAYRILLHRYSMAAGLEATFAALAGTMESLCYRIDFGSTAGDSPAALGNRIADAVIAFGRADGALEPTRYVDVRYRPRNEPLVVADGAPELRDPARWQPLALSTQVAQNGLALPGKVQAFVGPHWGHVKAFALPTARGGLPLDPGPPPAPGDAAFVAAALDVLRRSSELDPRDGVVVDVGPGARGDNPPGTDDGDGHDVNPATGRPYAANPVLRADHARALSEYWADGPDSETPPGHWNSIANDVSDALAASGRLEGDRLEWDVKLYFALNGALHDAAVAAWGAKGHYETVRPISTVRWLAARGELPLVQGLVERVTRGSSSPGGRHAHLANHVGELAVRAWRGPPDDPEADTSGVGWIRAAEWMPYQRATFVTPAFAGYVSGHSTFSRAAAEVLAAATGTPYFPGGLHEWKVPRGTLVHESGPSRDIVLQWATYHDAADDAGISRLYGGIHIAADDLAGRRLGALCGKAAWELAGRYYEGRAG